MRTIILCGGKGTRLREKTEYIPKPLVEVGGRPILYHIIDNYFWNGFREFDLACGYKGEMIEDYISRNPYESDNVEIVCHDTGIDTQTANRVEKINPDQDFMVTYGDGVSNLDIKGLVRTFLTAKEEFMMLVTGSKARSKWGLLETKKMPGSTHERLLAIHEKPILNDKVNCGFWVVQKEALKYIRKNESTEQWCARLTVHGLVAAYLHDGFWYGMDTYKDYEHLNKIWNENKTWNVNI